MSIAISINNISKSYWISNNKSQTLRDRLSQMVKVSYSKFFQNDPQLNSNSRSKFTALDNISFDIGVGEKLGIIGKNGAGKSTLLKILSKITLPDSGYITIKGKVSSLLEVGTGFHPELTGMENIYLNGAIMGLTRKEIKSRFEEIVAFSGCEAFLTTPVKRYSSGMYVRLAFAVAAHLDPEILIVDEVLAVGDAEFQDKCFGKMNEISNEGRTIIFVTHNMSALKRFCNCGVLLEKGQLTYQSHKVDDLIERYLKSDQIKSKKWSIENTTLASPYFTPLEFEVKQENDFEFISYNEEICFIIKGEILNPDENLQIGIAIYNKQNDLIFWTIHVDNKPTDRIPITKGIYKGKVNCPAELLNQGEYRAELFSAIFFKEWILEPENNSPTIYFTVQKKKLHDKFLDAEKPGMIAPLLHWKNEICS